MWCGTWPLIKENKLEIKKPEFIFSLFFLMSARLLSKFGLELSNILTLIEKW